jgi:hypothetical protein
MNVKIKDKKVSDSFWFDQPEILWDKDRLAEFFPTVELSLEERLNAILRLSIYISIILSIYKSDIRFCFIAVFTAIFTYYIYENKPKKEEVVETFGEKDQQACTMPTVDNPFMNVTMKDYLNIKDEQIVDRPPACDVSDPEVKKEIEKNFNNNLFRDVNDVFGRMNSQRQFFSMPWTTIPNKQDEFANWLYKSPKTCKEDQDYCVRYEDLRSNRPVLQEPTQNPVETKRLD